jgi:hypothetical protein
LIALFLSFYIYRIFILIASNLHPTQDLLLSFASLVTYFSIGSAMSHVVSFLYWHYAHNFIPFEIKNVFSGDYIPSPTFCISDCIISLDLRIVPVKCCIIGLLS